MGFYCSGKLHPLVNTWKCQRLIGWLGLANSRARPTDKHPPPLQSHSVCLCTTGNTGMVLTQHYIQHSTSCTYLHPLHNNGYAYNYPLPPPPPTHPLIVSIQGAPTMGSWGSCHNANCLHQLWRPQQHTTLKDHSSCTHIKLFADEQIKAVCKSVLCNYKDDCTSNTCTHNSYLSVSEQYEPCK